MRTSTLFAVLHDLVQTEFPERADEQDELQDQLIIR